MYFSGLSSQQAPLNVIVESKEFELAIDAPVSNQFNQII